MFIPRDAVFIDCTAFLFDFNDEGLPVTRLTNYKSSKVMNTFLCVITWTYHCLQSLTISRMYESGWP